MANHVEYDPQIIQTFADRLYVQANSIITVCTLIGLAVGCGGGFYAGYRDNRMIYALLGGLFFGLLGFAIGRARAFALKLKAQIALCQVKIERNTQT